MKIRAGKEQDYIKFVEVNSPDDYSRSFVAYTQRWADMMEALIETAGATVAQIANSTSHLADIEFISGAMFRYAVNALFVLWEYGDELGEWHKKECGVYCGG